MLQPLLARQLTFPSMLPLPPLLVLLQPMPRTDTTRQLVCPLLLWPPHAGHADDAHR